MISGTIHARPLVVVDGTNVHRTTRRDPIGNCDRLYPRGVRERKRERERAERERERERGSGEKGKGEREKLGKEEGGKGDSIGRRFTIGRNLLKLNWRGKRNATRKTGLP